MAPPTTAEGARARRALSASSAANGATSTPTRRPHQSPAYGSQTSPLHHIDSIGLRGEEDREYHASEDEEERSPSGSGSGSAMRRSTSGSAEGEDEERTLAGPRNTDRKPHLGGAAADQDIDAGLGPDEGTDRLGYAEKGAARGPAEGEKAQKDEQSPGFTDGNKVRRTKSEMVPAEERNWKDDISGRCRRTLSRFLDGIGRLKSVHRQPANPKNWSFRRRYLITALLGATTMSSTFASSIFSSATGYVAQQYHVSTEVATLGTSLFLAGYIPGPIFWAPLSEVFGRKIVFAPMVVFICFSAATATSKDLQSIMITRFFGGVFASAPVTTVGGGLADMFDQRERASAVVFYSLAVVAGPTISPLIGASVSDSYLGWRWTEVRVSPSFTSPSGPILPRSPSQRLPADQGLHLPLSHSQYLVVILASVITFIGILLVPETFAPVILTKKASRLRRTTGRWALHSRPLTRPLQMLIKEPMVLAICTYNSFTYGILYLLFGAVPIIFEQNRHWTPVQSALPFLAVLVGTLTAAAINLLYSTFVFAPYLDKHDGKARPELRLPPMMLGGVIFPISFFILGWAGTAGKIVALWLLGAAFLLIFQSGINYLIDGYTVYSASAVAANTFMRSIFASALPLVAQPLFHNLGVGRASSLLGGIAAGLGTVPFLFYSQEGADKYDVLRMATVYGPKLRGLSKMAKSD
ncbi:SPOSA6832_02992 [Sporobolomyces salmonicolor]|uniref:SPOSA6832_02992-mRNA-1:cds n=1 Tax=Sporidiobolus salmonicolor TaxID=5005 RepID=A0A0D6EN25_SPOSA|nr:SPOSA6832_02992 [Sporobolomyces salmonicolor]